MLVYDPSLACPQHEGKPVGIAFALLKYLVKKVPALWGADECRPTLPIAQRRPQNLRPCPWIEIGNLIQHNAIEIYAPHSVVIVSAVEADTGARLEVNPQLAFVDDGAGYGRRELLQVCPRYVLCLHMQGRHVGIA